MRRRSSVLLLAAALAWGGAAAAQELGRGGATSVFLPDGGKVLAMPSDTELVAAAPAARNPTGSAVMACKATPAGQLGNCSVLLARGGAFGAALIALAPRYRVEMPKEATGQDDVVVTASWPVPDVPADWQVKPKRGDFAITYTDAAWKSGKPGYAVMNCLQGKLGELRQCVAVYQSPPGKGFGKMLLMFQTYLKLKPATIGGRPIASAVNVGFHFAAHTPDEKP